jgi:hypothetical protein
MLLGPFLMVSGLGFESRQLEWGCQIAGAAMVMLALFYLSIKLHEQMEEVASLRELLDARDDTRHVNSHI